MLRRGPDPPCWQPTRGSEAVSFGEDEQCTLYWHPTTATSSSGHPEAERQAELATLRSRLQELDAQIAQHAPKETYLYPTTFRAHDTAHARARARARTRTKRARGGRRVGDWELGGTRAYNKEIGEHMERVHDYHELKDVAQALMGRLATIEGVLTRDLYKRYTPLVLSRTQHTHTRTRRHDTTTRYTDTIWTWKIDGR